MTPDQLHLAKALLATHSVADTAAMMARSIVGHVVTAADLEPLYRELHGIPEPIPEPVEPSDETLRDRLATLSAEQGSRILLRRQLQTGQHWFVDRERFRVACESVGLVA